MELSLDPRDLIRIAWRRKWHFLLPATLVVTLTASLILLLPPLFRSEATILIEHQDVPEDIVPSVITDYVDRRLDVLTQRVLVSDNLLEIAERFDLYPEERELMTRSAVAEMMRERIETETVSTEFNDPDTGRSGAATLAFQIRFTDRDPRTAQRVTNEIVSAYLSKNQEARRSAAEETTSFFRNEREALDRQIEAIETELTEFQTANREYLPEEAAFKRQLASNIEQELRLLDGNLRSLRERQSFLRTQLALTEEFEPGEMSAGAGITPETQLEQLRAELATAEARYNDRHPDVVRLRREVRSLERVVDGRGGGRSTALVSQEAALQAEIATLRERYTDDHPDVRRVERELAAVRDALSGAAAAPRGDAGLARNPVYVQLSAQLNSVEAEIGSVEAQQTELRERYAELQRELARAPAVERGYTRLNRRLDNAVAARQELADKEATAELSGSLETQALSERLTLIEPPDMPRSPVSPRKKLILALGLVLAIGSGGGTVVLAELLDRSIRSAKELARIVGDQPLAQIPNLVSPTEQRRRRWRQAVIVLGLAAAVAAAAYTVHRTVIPLDVVAYGFANRVETWVATTFTGAGDGEAVPTPGGQ